MANRNAANANGHRRRELRARILAEETHCGLCGKLVDKTLTMQWGTHSRRCSDPQCPGCVPHPMRPEVDEIIPRHQGGDPLSRQNCRLTHRACNAARNQRPPIQRDTFPTSRTW